jgi:beta-1,4-mannosyl-glycoprotein beta-1,4-N-acetylglucosaminyltransferase
MDIPPGHAPSQNEHGVVASRVGSRMRIFDTFMFDGELTLLRHRLTELYDLVDFFILVEARRTYTNRIKPLTFATHRDEFQWAAPKLRAVALDSLGGPALSAHQRAALQRNCVQLALRDAAPEDIVLLLDADEIPSRGLLLRLRRGVLDLPCRLQMTRHHTYLNVLAPASPCCPASDPRLSMQALRGAHPGRWNHLQPRWFGHSGVAVRYGELDDDHGSGSGQCAFALRFGSDIVAVAPEAGRHLCAVDPSAKLARKLLRVFHVEHATRRAISEDHLARCRRYGIHHLGWWCSEMPYGALPADLARLAHMHPGMTLRHPPGPRFVRQIVCAWAWLRLSQLLPDRLVSAIDRRFLASMCVLGLPLLLVQLMRSRIRRLALPAAGQSLVDHWPGCRVATESWLLARTAAPLDSQSLPTRAQRAMRERQTPAKNSPYTHPDA